LEQSSALCGISPINKVNNAVLSVNYRGSTGFGKAFVSAGEKQHAAKMHDDLTRWRGGLNCRADER
jgi:hypothetical protein